MKALLAFLLLGLSSTQAQRANTRNLCRWKDWSGKVTDVGCMAHMQCVDWPGNSGKAFCEPRSCNDAADCGNGFDCTDFQCQPKKECSGDSDCPDGWQCGVIPVLGATGCRQRPADLFQHHACRTSAGGVVTAGRQCPPGFSCSRQGPVLGGTKYNMCMKDKRIFWEKIPYVCSWTKDDGSVQDEGCWPHYGCEANPDKPGEGMCMLNQCGEGGACDAGFECRADWEGVKRCLYRRNCDQDSDCPEDFTCGGKQPWEDMMGKKKGGRGKRQAAKRCTMTKKFMMDMIKGAACDTSPENMMDASLRRQCAPGHVCGEGGPRMEGVLYKMCVSEQQAAEYAEMKARIEEMKRNGEFQKQLEKWKKNGGQF